VLALYQLPSLHYIEQKENAMDRKKEYSFAIADYTPETLPMARLSRYLAEFSRLLGEESEVHFVGVREGSARLVAAPNFDAEERVSRRVDAIQRGAAPQDALKAYKALDELLAEDKTSGNFTDPAGATVIEFPGIKRPRPLAYGPFKERGFLDGELVRVGGIDRTVPVVLKNGSHTFYCTASVEMSKKIARYYREGTLRVHGVGKWLRHADSTWEIEDFQIEDFEVLDETSLQGVRDRLQEIGPTGWAETDDPLSEILRLRNDGGMQ